MYGGRKVRLELKPGARRGEGMGGYGEGMGTLGIGGGGQFI